MKADLQPLYFEPGRDEGFDNQLSVLLALLGDQANFLAPRPLGSELPPCDAVLFPQLLGEAYRQRPALRALPHPILVLTSEFGTLSMWDWEICAYLRAEGVHTIAPYTLELTRTAVAALATKRALRSAKFVVYQDSPGEGFQAPIFKRFYWWEEECAQRIFDKFGPRIEVRSFKELAAKAREISDAEAHQAWEERSVPNQGLTDQNRLSAAKLYLALTRELEADATVRGLGINCLNESHCCDTTPCLAWNFLYHERRLIWGCEADTLSMLTQFIVHEILHSPLMMTNLYPFVLGEAALKHERIERFPSVDTDPANHLLVAHCGYLGLLPQEFSCEWALRPKVLGIVDGNATAVDARLPLGPVTLVKLHPTLDAWSVGEGALKGYAQYPGSDCLNGGIVEVRDGRRMMEQLVSHHYVLVAGHHRAEIEMAGKILGLSSEVF